MKYIQTILIILIVLQTKAQTDDFPRIEIQDLSQNSYADSTANAKIN